MTIAIEALVLIIGVAVLAGWIGAILSRSNRENGEKPKRSPALRGDMTTELERLFSLYQSGALSDEEYQALKARLIEGKPITTPDLQPQVEELLRNGKKIEAIKLYRQNTDLGLKEAKDAVEEIERTLRSH
jgi:hypothetical protein